MSLSDLEQESCKATGSRVTCIPQVQSENLCYVNHGSKCSFLILILIVGEWSLYMLPSLAPLAKVHWENILLGVLLEVELTEVWWLLCLRINGQALVQYKLNLSVSDGGMLQNAVLFLSWMLSVHWSFVSTAFQKLTLLPSVRRSPNYRTVYVTSCHSPFPI
jgi:hypothetical protein